MPPLSAIAPGSNGSSYALLQASCVRYLWVPFFISEKKHLYGSVWILQIRNIQTKMFTSNIPTHEICHVPSLRIYSTKQSCLLQIKVICLICHLIYTPISPAVFSTCRFSFKCCHIVMINADICRQWSGILHTYIVKKWLPFPFILYTWAFSQLWAVNEEAVPKRPLNFCW